MGQQPSPDLGGQITLVGTILAAVAAGLAAVWRLGSALEAGLAKDTKAGAIAPDLSGSVERTAGLLAAASSIIDQLQEENRRLIQRLAEQDDRIRRQEDVIAELRHNSGPPGRSRT